MKHNVCNILQHLLARGTIATCSICVWAYRNWKDVGGHPYAGESPIHLCCSELCWMLHATATFWTSTQQDTW